MAITYTSNTPAIYTPQQTYVSQYAPLDTRALMRGMAQYRGEINRGEQNQAAFKGALSNVNSIKEMDHIRRERLNYYNQRSNDIATRAANKEINPYEVNREINNLAQEFQVDPDVRALEYTFKQKQQFDKEWNKLSDKEKRNYNNSYSNWINQHRTEGGYSFRDEDGNLDVFQSGDIKKAVEYDKKFKSDIASIAADKNVWSSIRDQGDAIFKQRGYKEAVTGNKLKDVSNKLALSALTGQEGRQYLEDTLGRNIGVDSINDIEDGTVVVEEEGQLVAYDQSGNRLNENQSAKLYAANRLAENYYNLGYKQVFQSGGVSSNDLRYKPKHILEPDQQRMLDFNVTLGQDFQGQKQLDLKDLKAKQIEAYRSGDTETATKLWNQMERVMSAARKHNPGLDQRMKSFREKYPKLPKNFEMNMFNSSIGKSAFGFGGEGGSWNYTEAILGEEYTGDLRKDRDLLKSKYDIDIENGDGMELAKITETIQGQFTKGLEGKAFDLIEDLNGNSNLVSYSGIAVKKNNITDKITNIYSDSSNWEMIDEEGKLKAIPENDDDFKFNAKNLEGWEISTSPVGDSFLIKAYDPKSNTDFYKKISKNNSQVVNDIAQEYMKTAEAYYKQGDRKMGQQAQISAWKLLNPDTVSEVNEMAPFETKTFNIMGGDVELETIEGGNGDLRYKVNYIDSNGEKRSNVVDSRENIFPMFFGTLQ